MAISRQPPKDVSVRKNQAAFAVVGFGKEESGCSSAFSEIVGLPVAFSGASKTNQKRAEEGSINSENAVKEMHTGACVDNAIAMLVA